MSDGVVRGFRRVLSGLLGLVLIGGAASAQDMPVRYAVDGFVLGTLIRVANHEGYFEEEGIDPTILTFSYGVDTVDAVLAGQADFGVIIDMPILTRFSSGALTAVAIIGVPDPGWHKLYVPANYAGLEDLAGMTFAVAPGTAQDFVTRSYLTDNGLDPDTDVDLVNFSSLFEIVGAMRAGRVDAAWIWGQGVEEIADVDAFEFLVDDSVVNQQTTALLVVSNDYLAEHRDGVVATLRALDRAGAVVEAELTRTAEIVANDIAGDAASIEPVIAGQNYGLSFAQGAVDSLRAKYDFLLAADLIDPPYEFADYIDLGPLRDAAPNGDIVDSLN